MSRTPPRISRLPLRVRLVAGFSVAMLVLLTAAGAFVYWRVQYALDRGLDTELEQATSVIGPLVDADGTVTTTDAADATGLGWQVLDDEGRVLDSGGPAPAQPLVSDTRLASLGGSGTQTFDVGSFLPISDSPYRVRVTPLASSPSGAAAYLLVGVRRDHRDEALRELLVQLGVAGLVALAIASLVGYVLARLALEPVERYRRRAAEVAAAGTPDLRLDVSVTRDDEVTRLGHTLNTMLAALERSLERERRFVNDASHELRTPLTLLQSRIQLTRRRSRSIEEHELALDELAVDVARLADLAEQLLELEQPPPVGSDGSDVGGMVEAVVARWQAAHPDQQGDIHRDVPPHPVRARTEPQVLERMVTNLLGNALTHGRPPVRLAVRHEDGHAVLTVDDAGDGMRPELLAAATRRFHRAPEARARPGAGLGLSIVEQLVADAGGELRLCHGDHHESTGRATALPCRHGVGMTVTVILPAG